jgi:ribosomal-protein-alanine N-acetyltransferase
MIQVQPMTREWAQEIALWTYPGIYAQYSFQNTPETVAHLLNGAYYAVSEDQSPFPIGLYCYGPSAQIPTLLPDVYPPTRLDIGLGLHPSLCGRGAGESFLRVGMEFGRRRFGSLPFRLSVAAFNQRAITVYTRAGFRTSRIIRNARNGLPYHIMERPPLPNP